MIEVVRPCWSPACRGALYKQRIPCEVHPDTVDCSATCAERLASRRSQCLFCGEWNDLEPPEGDPYGMVFPGASAGKEGGERPRSGDRGRERPAGAGKRRRRGRPGRRRKKKNFT